MSMAVALCLKSVTRIILMICAQWNSCKGDEDGENNSTIIYKDPGQPVEARVEDLLSRMTVAEKIGQMTQIQCGITSPDVIREFGIWSILNGGGSAPAPQASANVWADMVDSFQDAAMSTDLGIPMIFLEQMMFVVTTMFTVQQFSHIT